MKPVAIHTWQHKCRAILDWKRPKGGSRRSAGLNAYQIEMVGRLTEMTERGFDEMAVGWPSEIGARADRDDKKRFGLDGCRMVK